MIFEWSSVYEGTSLDEILQALKHIRKHQLESRVTYVPRKDTATHCVHELQYETAFLLAPLIGAHVVLREDIVVTGSQIIVTTVSPNYKTRVFPYMMTDTVFRPCANDAVESTVKAEWGLSEYIPDIALQRLTSFGQSIYADAAARLLESVGTVRSSTRLAK